MFYIRFYRWQVHRCFCLLVQQSCKPNLWHAYRKTTEKYYNNAFELIVCQAYILSLEKEESSLEVQSWRKKMWETPIIQQWQWVLWAGHSSYRTYQSSHSVMRKHSLECKAMSSGHPAKQSQHWDSHSSMTSGTILFRYKSPNSRSSMNTLNF